MNRNVLRAGLGFLAVLMLGKPVLAQQTVRLQRGESPWSVTMTHCRGPLWIGKVMELSGITIDQVRRLPIGREISLPACAGAPPAEVATASTQILAVDQQRTRSAAVPAPAPGPDPALQNKIAELEKELALERKIKATALAAAKQASISPSPVPTATLSWWRIVFAFAGGLLAASLAFLLWYRRALRRQVEPEHKSEGVVLPLARTIQFDGQPYTFPLTSYEPRLDRRSDEKVMYFACPLCGERKIMEPNFKDHLRKNCPKLRQEEKVEEAHVGV